jgi:hypothetical protein
MKFKFILGAAAGFCACLGLGDAMSAELLKFGTTYMITGTGFTGTGSSTANFTDTVTLSSKPQTFNHGTLQITEHTTFLPAGGEFAEFYISTKPRLRHVRPPLVANGSSSNVTFVIKLSGIQLRAPAITAPYNAGYFDFTTNGVANAGITTSSLFGLLGVEADPNSGSIGAGKNVFYCPSCSTRSAATTTGYNEAQGPFYKSVTDLNINPNANGYFFGLRLITRLPLRARGTRLSRPFRPPHCKTRAAVRVCMGS